MKIKTTRHVALMARVAMTAAFATNAFADGLPPLNAMATYKVGFAQSESNNQWRLAETASMKVEAEKLGWQLVYTDAAGSAAKQVAGVNSMIAQGVDVIFLSPREAPRGEAAGTSHHGGEEGRRSAISPRPQR